MKFRLDAQALALGSNFTFEVDGEYALDLLAYLEPVGTYDDFLAGSETVRINGRTVRVIGAIVERLDLARRPPHDSPR